MPGFVCPYFSARFAWRTLWGKMYEPLHVVARVGYADHSDPSRERNHAAASKAGAGTAFCCHRPGNVRLGTHTKLTLFLRGCPKLSELNEDRTGSQHVPRAGWGRRCVLARATATARGRTP